MTEHRRDPREAAVQRAGTRTPRQRWYWTLHVYVPAPGSILHGILAPRTAVVGRPTMRPEPEAKAFVDISYEGNLYGAVNMVEYEDKLLHAAGRLVTNYPTVARRLCPLSDLIEVGTYDYGTRELTVTDPDTLNAWKDSQ